MQHNALVSCLLAQQPCTDTAQEQPSRVNIDAPKQQQTEQKENRSVLYTQK
jgi:hypothetical protein